MRQPAVLYKRHRFPGELISHALWLYYRFLLSYQDIEELLAERGVAVSYETIRRWCRRFGQAYAGVRDVAGCCGRRIMVLQGAAYPPPPEPRGALRAHGRGGQAAGATALVSPAPSAVTACATARTRSWTVARAGS